MSNNLLVNIFIYVSSLISVHPCDKDSKGGCEQLCNKDGVNAKCSCNEGYKLNADGVACDKSEYKHYIIDAIEFIIVW